MVDDVVFTTYNQERDITYTLLEGEEDHFGWSHILKKRPFMVTRLDGIIHAVEDPDFSVWDSSHSETGDKERIYCLGACKERPNMYMVVIAKYTEPRTASITTAWQMEDLPKDIGVVIYDKNNK